MRKLLSCCSLLTLCLSLLAAAGRPPAAHRGIHEVTLTSKAPFSNPYRDVEVRVAFTPPGRDPVTVDAFYDGSGTWKARAYCHTPGEWKWSSSANHPSLDDLSGAFRVAPSNLPGKLRIHPDDPYQFQYANGDWFLHIGDTGYRYLTATEPEWQAYIDQAARLGATKIRTWFCQGRSDVQVLFGDTRDTLNLPYWQEMDRRIAYSQQHHPRLQLKLIPYGEDTSEIRRYGRGDEDAKFIARYAQARFSAYPNIHWCITNDREIVAGGVELKGRRVRASTIAMMGRDMAEREPWGTLLTNHQSRFSGYAHIDEPWSDITTLEDLDQVTGQVLLDYRQKGRAPVINDEDRYENYRFPKHSRYFFRRLMWASLLSGGHATYGGLRTYEPFDGGLAGVQGYYDAVAANKLQAGAHDFIHIHEFFRDSGLTLAGMDPGDAACGNDPVRWKCAHTDATWIIYLANPTDPVAELAGESATIPAVTLTLPPATYTARWFNPSTGHWTTAEAPVNRTKPQFAPGPGDWVLLLQESP